MLDTRKLSMNFFGCFNSGRISKFRGRKVAKVFLPSLESDVSRPVTITSKEGYTFKPRRIIFAKSGVETVLDSRGLSKIAPSVVCTIAVNVANLVRGKLACHPKEHYPMGQVKSFVDTYTDSVTSGIKIPRFATFLYTIGRTYFPHQFTSIRKVIQKVTNLFLCKCSSFHGVIYKSLVRISSADYNPTTLLLRVNL